MSQTRGKGTSSTTVLEEDLDEVRMARIKLGEKASSVKATPRRKTDAERIHDLERVVGKLSSDLTNARAQLERVSHNLEVAEAMVVRTSEGEGSWRDATMTAMEGDFQRLKHRVENTVKARSKKYGFDDYSQDARLQEMWGGSGVDFS